jgi:hypothetical protein
MSPGKVCSGLVGFSLLAAAATVVAQSVAPQGVDLQPDLSGTIFRVRVVNDSTTTFYYKLVGGPGRPYVHQTLAPGASDLVNATGGDKVLCIWTPGGTLLGAWRTVVNRSGKIVVVDLPGPGVVGAQPQNGIPASLPPSMEVVPENQDEPSGDSRDHDQRRQSGQATDDEPKKEEIYVPKDLDDCFVELKKMLSKEDIEKIKDGTEHEMIRYHFGLGMWMRNNWGLWSGSRLSRSFNEKGIHHPDDMSGIILNSFWRHLNNKPIQLDEQIKFYQEYWKKAGVEQ